jgi:hypothetical protein
MGVGRQGVAGNGYTSRAWKGEWATDDQVAGVHRFPRDSGFRFCESVSRKTSW